MWLQARLWKTRGALPAQVCDARGSPMSGSRSLKGGTWGQNISANHPCVASERPSEHTTSVLPQEVTAAINHHFSNFRPARLWPSKRPAPARCYAHVAATLKVVGVYIEGPRERADPPERRAFATAGAPRPHASRRRRGACGSARAAARRKARPQSRCARRRSRPPLLRSGGPGAPAGERSRTTTTESGAPPRSAIERERERC